ncbi:MAG: ImmA/IrrE family metallo-endopeptidase [Clostridia bacterium]|nr:ImmA/IrrE family metallo-endopeptidase [Clostridia bacterium]
METNKLYCIAEKQGVTVDRFNVRENKSVSVKSGKNLYVGLDNELKGASEKVCLAHELGHCLTYSFYNIYSPFDVREKHEKRADKWAIHNLIPEKNYKFAVENGYDTVFSLAEYFGVTVDFMEKAVRLYSPN